MDKQYFKGPFKGKIQQAIAEETANVLMMFCEQRPEFEQAIEQSGKTYQQCLDAVAKGVGSSLSDLKVYNKAVKFYFSTAKVHCDMWLDLAGDNGHKDPPITQTTMHLSLDALLDF